MRTIFHVDVNSAFLSWEAVYRMRHQGQTLDLREIPSAVAGDAAVRHGIILAKSIPAKRAGIRTGESIMEARQKLPDLCLVPPNYNLYSRCSRAFQEILRSYTPSVEVYSIDECYMDMTGTEKIYGEPAEVAEQIKKQIYEELGFTVNIGISSNKLLAKMASDFKKPDLVHTLYQEEISEKMWPLPVSELFFVGPATARKLQKIGISTVGELAGADPVLLKRMFKKHGEIIWGFANGMDTASVEPAAPPNKGYGNSTTTPMDVKDSDMAALVLLSLTETVAARLRADQVKAGVVAVSIKTADFRHMSRQVTLTFPTDLVHDLHQTVCCLFGKLWDGSPIRHLGIHTSRISAADTPRQINLFEDGREEKYRCAEQAVDRIRNRYGADALLRASFLKVPIDHMSGGISREKRSVDYSKQIIF